MRELRALSPGKLGHGCYPESIANGLRHDPHFIAVDAGTTDIGAYYLGSGAAFYQPASVKRDLVPLLRAAHARRIPLILGNMVATGRNDQLALGLALVREVAREESLQLRVAAIRAEIDRAYLARRLAEEPIVPLGARAALTPRDVAEAAAIVAQMGVEPIIRALDAGAQVVVAGRACDDALFAAIPVRDGYDKGLALHMGKILECGSMSCVPGDLHGSLVGTLREDHFVLDPADEHRVATVQSVASHTLYERSDPYLQAGPGGINDLTACRFEQLDARRVKVSGSRWVETPRYLIKLEGVRHIGHRTICMTGIRDPVLIGCLDEVLAQAHDDVRKRFGDAGWQLVFRQYGRNAVMGRLEPKADARPHEIGLLIEAIAPSQALADDVCMYARGTIQHAFYPGIVATAGNLAYPISPFTVPSGPVYVFHMDHLMPLADPCECFPMELETVGRPVSAA